MHSCEITLSVYLKWKNYIDVCTGHWCANIFRSHVKPSCSLVKKHCWRSSLADPNTPRWPRPQVGPSHQPRSLTQAGGAHSGKQSKPFLLSAVAGCCQSCSEGLRGFGKVTSNDFGWTCAVSPTAKPWVLCLLPPWASSGDQHSSYDTTCLEAIIIFFFSTELWQREVGWGWSTDCIFCIRMTLEGAKSCKVSWVTRC